MTGISRVLQPGLLMTLAMICYSAFPVLFALGDVGQAPFMFAGLLQLCVGAGLGLPLLLFNRRLLTGRGVLVDIGALCRSGLMAVSVAGSCGFALFTLAFLFLDVSVAAILFEMRPLFLILFLAYLFRGAGRYNPITLRLVVFVALAICAVSLVVLSQSPATQPLYAAGRGLVAPGALIGVCLVLFAAVCSATRAASLKFGATLAQAHIRDCGTSAEIVLVVFMNCITNFLAGVVLCVIAVFLGESMSTDAIRYALAGAVLVDSIGVVAGRLAILKTDNLGVNAISYATPLVALVWLWAASLLDVPHPDYLVIGAMGIVAANLLINAGGGVPVHHKALAVSIWVFGTAWRLAEQHHPALSLPPVLDALLLACFSGSVFFVFMRIDMARGTPRSSTRGGRFAVLAASGIMFAVFACVFALV